MPLTRPLTQHQLQAFMKAYPEFVSTGLQSADNTLYTNYGLVVPLSGWTVTPAMDKVLARNGLTQNQFFSIYMSVSNAMVGFMSVDHHLSAIEAQLKQPGLSKDQKASLDRQRNKIVDMVRSRSGLPRGTVMLVGDHYYDLVAMFAGAAEAATAK